MFDTSTKHRNNPQKGIEIGCLQMSRQHTQRKHRNNPQKGIEIKLETVKPEIKERVGNIEIIPRRELKYVYKHSVVVPPQIEKHRNNPQKGIEIAICRGGSYSQASLKHRNNPQKGIEI